MHLLIAPNELVVEFFLFAQLLVAPIPYVVDAADGTTT